VKARGGGAPEGRGNARKQMLNGGEQRRVLVSITLQPPCCVAVVFREFFACGQVASLANTKPRA